MVNPAPRSAFWTIDLRDKEGHEFELAVEELGSAVRAKREFGDALELVTRVLLNVRGLEHDTPLPPEGDFSPRWMDFRAVAMKLGRAIRLEVPEQVVLDATTPTDLAKTLLDFLAKTKASR